MTTVERLQQWKHRGTITEAQYTTLAAIVLKSRFSVFLELNALLYLGVLSLAGGLGWTFQKHFASLGDIFILSILSLGLAGCTYYCAIRAPAFSLGETESPNFIFDYVVYLACLLLSVELGYLEFRLEWLKDSWDYYLLFSSVVFFVMAYRFDNRLVLSLALSSLAGFFGFKVYHFGLVSSEPLRISGLTYGAAVIATGVILCRWGIKKHFLETFLHIASIAIFIALVSGLWGDRGMAYFIGLVGAMGIAIALGVRFRRFVFVEYGAIFGYVGISREVLRGIHDDTMVLGYFVFSGAIVLASMVFVARRFGREA